MYCGLIMECKSLATTSIQCITWIQYICQRVTIHITSDIYVCLANLTPLTFPHEGIYVNTCLYTFDPPFCFTIQMTRGLVEHVVECLLVVTRGATVVHTVKEVTDPFMMSRLIICVCTQLPSCTYHHQITRVCIEHR